MPRIAIDMSVLNHPFRSGIQRYTENLFQALLKIKNAYEYMCIGCDENRPQYAQIGSPLLSLASGTGHLKNAFLSLIAHAESCDAIFCPWGSLPERRSCSGVLTVHDMIPLEYPQWAVNENILVFFREQLPSSLKKADAVIAVSEYTRNEMIKHYGLEKDRIHVVYHGVEERFFSPDQNTEFSNLFSRYKPYILSTSVFEPRKNQMRLIEAFNHLKENHQAEGWKLLLVGPKGWAYKDIFQAIEASPFKNDIFNLNELSEAELLACYAQADIFIYPSLVEGFGLPVLEAMAARVPVITSNVSALPEVGGDAVLYCEPMQVDSIEESLRNLISNEELRKSLSQRGQERAKLFTWERAAKNTLAVFEKALA